MSLEPMSFQLRFMQNLSSNSFNKDTTIFFPVPIPMMNIPLPSRDH
ncbi:hypothetical protein BLA29_013629 [Euroglyphus maynei]|uniref:Uncharacterized protein n=1 Tax=Euroglyphus maynei TaxID=6958 RepID=A0A1Y3BMM3_EURMA|nr:hypothetical protein BLA29_013629 [Euroglyphus maynei]